MSGYRDQRGYDGWQGQPSGRGGGYPHAGPHHVPSDHSVAISEMHSTHSDIFSDDGSAGPWSPHGHQSAYSGGAGGYSGDPSGYAGSPPRMPAPKRGPSVGDRRRESGSSGVSSGSGFSQFSAFSGTTTSTNQDAGSAAFPRAGGGTHLAAVPSTRDRLPSMQMAPDPTPEQLQGYLSEAIAMRKRGQFKEALHLFQQLFIYMDTIDAKYHNQFAILFQHLAHSSTDTKQKQQYLNKAEEQFIKCLAIDQKSYVYYANYADLLRMQKRPKSACEFYRKALKLNPKHAFTLNNYAFTLHMSLQQYSKACIEYEKCLKLQPNDVVVVTNYAMCLKQLKQHKQAERILRPFIFTPDGKRYPKPNPNAAKVYREIRQAMDPKFQAQQKAESKAGRKKPPPSPASGSGGAPPKEKEPYQPQPVAETDHAMLQDEDEAEPEKIHVNADELQSLLDEIEQLKSENQKLLEQLEESQLKLGEATRSLTAMKDDSRDKGTIKLEYEQQISDLHRQLKKLEDEKNKEIAQINKSNYQHVQTLLAAMQEQKDSQMDVMGGAGAGAVVAADGGGGGGMDTLKPDRAAFMDTIDSMREMAVDMHDGETISAMNLVNRLLVVEKCYQPFSRVYVPEFRNSPDADDDEIPPAPTGVVARHKEIPQITDLVETFQKVFTKNYAKVMKCLMEQFDHKTASEIMFNVTMYAYQLMIVEKFTYLAKKDKMKAEMDRVFHRWMNFCTLASREDPQATEIIMMVAELSGLNELEIFTDSEQTQDLMFGYVSNICEVVWHLLMSETTLERYILYPPLFDSEMKESCAEHLTFPITMRTGFSYDISWHEMYTKSKASKKTNVYYVYPALLKIARRGGSQIQQVLVKATVGPDEF